MSWGKKTAGGIEYDLTHLDPFTLAVTPKGDGAPTYNVRVTFTCHTFTREWLAGDAEEFRVPDVYGDRAFCPTRHGHSLHLRPIIETASLGKVYFNNQTPFLIAAPLPGMRGPYAVYFNAHKATAPGLDVVLDVRSAHHKPNLATNLPRITFATVIGHTAAGKPIIRPKK